MSDNHVIIALDGPSGAGKSTIAKLVAKKINLLYIDTGAMYRAITYIAIDNNINVNNEEKINSMLNNTNLEFKMNEDNNIDIYYNKNRINDQLRTQIVEKNVSKISSYAKVREHCVTLQRKIPKNYNCILDGRDIGTVVFPDTPYKFYLDASVNERAKRRMNDTKNKENLSLKKIQEDITRRDKFDSSREISPLKKAEDAVYIDSSDMSINKVVQFIMKEYNK